MLVALSHRQDDRTPLSPDQERLLDSWVAGRLCSIDADRAAHLAKRNVFAAERVLEHRLISAANEGPTVPGPLARRVLRASRSSVTRTARIYNLRWSTLRGWQWSGLGALAAATVAIAVLGFHLWQQQIRPAQSTCGDFCGASPLLAQSQTQSPLGDNTSDVQGIPLKVQGGTFLIPVLINGQITLNFAIDSGATYVSIPADVVLTLIRTGTVQKSDFMGQENFRLANGSIVPSKTFLIHSLKVGNYLLENVKASVADIKAVPLLGQSLLSRFDSWSIDNERQVLLLNPKTQQQQVQQSCTASIATAAQHFTGLVTGFLTDEQVLAVTRSVEAQLGAKLNPAYLRLKHVWVSWQNGSSMTMAAVPEHMSVKIGDSVELNSRYRDPSLPCHFIPWTINRLLAQP
ncbi:MAG TPA: retropepsin-like aspartic protease [Xanthobacteraceae bacterium]|jgi:hypothetical protein